MAVSLKEEDIEKLELLRLKVKWIFSKEELKGENLWLNSNWLKQASIISLHGKPLQIPRMYLISLNEDEASIERDNPDQMKSVWNTPEFITGKDPCEQKKNVFVEDIDLDTIGIEIDTKDGWRFPSFLKIVHNILTPEQCAELIYSINEKGNVM